MNWIKLTPAQAAELAALSASNPGNDFVTARLDKFGSAWLGSDVLGAADQFEHYAAFLAGLAPTHYAEPQWPVSPL